MNVFAVHDEAGNILRVETTPYCYLKCEDHVGDETHYVLNGLIAEKTMLGVTHEVQGLAVVFRGLAAGVRVSTDGHFVVTDGTELEVSYDIPGTYTIELYPPPQYLDETLEVTVG